MALPIQGRQGPSSGVTLKLRGGSELSGSLEPSVGEKILGGTLTGLRRNPLLRPVVDGIAEQFGGVPKKTLDRMEDRLSRSRLSDVFEFVGEFGPDLALGGGAFALGRRAALLGLSRLPSIGARTAEFLAQEAGHAGVGLPGLARAAQIAGGSTGIGSFEAARSAAAGDSPSEIAKHAALGAVLTGAFEVGLTGVGAAVARRSRLAPGGAAQAEVFTRGGAQVFEAEEARLGTAIGRQAARLEKLNQQWVQEQSLVDAARGSVLPMGISEEGARKISQRLAQAEAKANRLSDVTIPKAERLLEQRESTQKLARSFREDFDAATALYTRDASQPFNPGPVRQALEQIHLKILRTPESLKHQMGPSFQRSFNLWEEAESFTTIGRSFNAAKLIEGRETLKDALGFSGRQIRKDPSAFSPIFNTWEEGGTLGVERYMQQLGRSRAHIAQATEFFDDLKTTLRKMYEPLVELGGEKLLTAEELAGLSVREFLPHVLADLPEAEVRAALAKKLGEATADRIMGQSFREGLAKFGSIDFQRSIKGSLQHKLNIGLPFEQDPFEGLFRYMNSVVRRKEYGERFGFRGELRGPILEAIRKEGANPAIAANVLDIALGHNYYDQAMRSLSTIVTGYQTGSKLATAVIANLSQPVNNFAAFGPTAALRGIALATGKRESKDAVLGAVALMESVPRGTVLGFGEQRLGATLGGTTARLSNISKRFAFGVLRWTGFSKVEEMNRLSAGYTGLYVFRDTLSKALGRNLRIDAAGRLSLGAARGALKGQSLAIARRRMEFMGVNLDDVVRQIRARGDDYLQSDEFFRVEEFATYRSAQHTQFIPSSTRRPTLWNHPIGRVFFQFKQYALGQGRFIRDQVLAEAAQGNMKPLATFLAVYPVAGEIVGDLRSIVRNRPREDSGVARVIRNYSNVGGFGLATDTLVAAQYGRLGEAVLGPTVGGTVSFLEALARGDFDEIGRQTLRTPIVSTVLTGLGLGVLAADEIQELEFPNWGDSEGQPSRVQMDYGRAKGLKIQRSKETGR